ncbi:amidohydrolase [Dactylosporangium sp. NPDC051484]|uniref:amidohydrolase n=1 Tax=Dactylosporangium sp. NPDC051484 TaxID=3154942 RepID=UPI003450512B
MPEPSELLLLGGRILTMADGPSYSADSIAISGGTIRAVGRREDVVPTVSPGARVVELAGRVVTPGLVDTHTHLGATATGSSFVDCRDFYRPIKTVNDLLEILRAEADSAPDQELLHVMASPMQEFRLQERRLPTLAELDEAVPGRAVAVRFGGHISVVNSQTLKLLEISNSTPDPAGGFIARDRQGRATGVLHERAQLPLRPYLLEGGFEEYKTSIEAHLLGAAARGVTSIHEMVTNAKEIRAYQELEREGRLPLRVDLIVRVIESEISKWAVLELGLQGGFGSDMLRFAGIKMSIDGGFTGRMSAWTPVDGEPCGNHPVIRIEQDELDEVVAAYHDAGIRICVHAIGDRAADMVLQSYEKALIGDDSRDLRHRIEHMGNWLMDETRIRRTKALGVTPVPNPAFMYYLANEANQTLGSPRTEGSFPFRQLLDAGFDLTFGADSPIYWPIDPLRDAAVAISRRAIDGTEVALDQAITNYESLTAITASSAWLGFSERTSGTIEAGKFADLTVFSGDPLTADGDTLRSMPIVATYVGGREVWSAPTPTPGHDRA